MPSEKTSTLSELGTLHTELRHAEIVQRHGTAVDRGLRTKVRWEDRAVAPFESVLGGVPSADEIDAVIAAAEKDWKRIHKAKVREFFKNFRQLGLRLAALLAPHAQGGQAVYLSLAQDMSEDAGQHTLDTLGLDQTWRWTDPRDMARDQFAVRGSKVIQLAYGNHVGELQKMVVKATDPANPRSRKEVRDEIRKQWAEITRRDAERIARTETAAVWETTNFNAQRANDVTHFDWVIAHGPSIGGRKSEPVCPTCLKLAANGPYAADEVELPPAHPNCRCTLIPSLSHDWLPPAETWSGGPDPPLPLRPAEAP